MGAASTLVLCTSVLFSPAQFLRSPLSRQAASTRTSVHLCSIFTVFRIAFLQFSNSQAGGIDVGVLYVGAFLRAASGYYFCTHHVSSASYSTAFCISARR